MLSLFPLGGIGQAKSDWPIRTLRSSIMICLLLCVRAVPPRSLVATLAHRMCA